MDTETPEPSKEEKEEEDATGNESNETDSETDKVPSLATINQLYLNTFGPPPDFFFIDRTLDPLTQKVQRLIGWDCFDIAKIFGVAVFFLNILDIIRVSQNYPQQYAYYHLLRRSLG